MKWTDKAAIIFIIGNYVYTKIFIPRKEIVKDVFYTVKEKNVCVERFYLNYTFFRPIKSVCGSILKIKTDQVEFEAIWEN